jgi:uncharacterized protein YndB with AHSA1/START domain
MRSPDGRDFWSKGFFREIAAPKLLVMTDSFADENGNIVPASYYEMSKDFPLEKVFRLEWLALFSMLPPRKGGRAL